MIARSPDVLTRTGAFGVVILAGGARLPVTLQGSGARLWHLLAIPRTESELVNELARHYGADPTMVAADIGPALSRLAELGALEEQEWDRVT